MTSSLNGDTGVLLGASGYVKAECKKCDTRDNDDVPRCISGGQIWSALRFGETKKNLSPNWAER